MIEGKTIEIPQGLKLCLSENLNFSPIISVYPFVQFVPYVESYVSKLVMSFFSFIVLVLIICYTSYLACDTSVELLPMQGHNCTIYSN